MKKKTQEQNGQFGGKLKAFLDKEGRRYNWLCQEAGISWIRMQRIFKGSEPRTEELIQISKALGMSIDDLIHLETLLEHS